MSRNGSGTFVINSSGQPVVASTTITATVQNALTADLAVGLTQSICTDGQTTTTGLIPFAAGLKSTTINEYTATNGVALQGTTANPVTNAAAGYIGEYMESIVLVGAGINMGTGTPTDITTLTLTAGDWDIWGGIASAAAAGTITSLIAGGISTTINTLPTPPSNCYVQIQNTFPASANQVLPLGTQRVSINGSTTYHLVMRIDFSVSTMTGYGFVAARRRR